MDFLYARIQIVNLNNEAASRIDGGDLEGGTACLKVALTSSKALIRQEQQQLQPNNDKVPDFSLDQLVAPVEMQDLTKSLDCDDDEQPFIVRRPLRIDGSSGMLAVAGSSQMLATVIVFNLGITCHISALKHTEFSQQEADELQKAIRLYECAYNLQCSNSNVAVSTLLHMSILNNLAHAHSAVGNKTRADYCYQHLLSTLMYVVDNRQITTESASSLSTPQPCIRYFFRSTYHLIFSIQMQPAAAA